MMKMKNKASFYIVFLIGIVFGIILYQIASYVMLRTATIGIDSAQCLLDGQSGRVVVNIHNSGWVVIPINDLHILVDGSDPGFSCHSDFYPGSTSSCAANVFYSSAHVVEVQGPANTASSPLKCS